jgi:hypothetical protein
MHETHSRKLVRNIFPPEQYGWMRKTKTKEVTLSDHNASPTSTRKEVKAQEMIRLMSQRKKRRGEGKEYELKEDDMEVCVGHRNNQQLAAELRKAQEDLKKIN